MAQCAACGSNYIIGGVKEGDDQSCSHACKEKDFVKRFFKAFYAAVASQPEPAPVRPPLPAPTDRKGFLSTELTVETCTAAECISRRFQRFAKPMTGLRRYRSSTIGGRRANASSSRGEQMLLSLARRNSGPGPAAATQSGLTGSGRRRPGAGLAPL